MVPDHGGEEGVRVWIHIIDNDTDALMPVECELTVTERFLKITKGKLTERIELTDIKRLLSREEDAD